MQKQSKPEIDNRIIELVAAWHNGHRNGNRSHADPDKLIEQLRIAWKNRGRP